MNTNTALRAPRLLGKEGLLEFRRGHGVRVSDPLGGSYYIEQLTAQIEERCLALIEEIDQKGGLVACIESGRVQSEVNNAAFAWRQEVESGERTIVGVNKFQVQEEDKTPVLRPDPNVARMGLEDIDRLRARRDGVARERALEDLGADRRTSRRRRSAARRRI